MDEHGDGMEQDGEIKSIPSLDLYMHRISLRHNRDLDYTDHDAGSGGVALVVNFNP